VFWALVGLIGAGVEPGLQGAARNRQIPCRVYDWVGGDVTGIDLDGRFWPRGVFLYWSPIQI
jgi:hypothetical protein